MDPIHGVFAAYLFRNVTDRDEVLAGLFDLLADDGVLVVQEYSIAGSGPWGQLRLDAVCWLVIIPLGWLTSRRTRLYRYLWRSVLRLRLGPDLRRSVCTARDSSTSRCAPCRAGSAASCTRSARASQRASPS